MADEKQGFDENEMKLMADFIRSEFQRRVTRRHDLEMEWSEIDRQIAMTPRARKKNSGEAPDWYPNIEEPLQFNALEVILADATRMIFPKSNEWFSVTANLSDEYAKRFGERRADHPLIAGERILLDQDGADTMVKAAVDHFHRMYDFRSNWAQFVGEIVKYGTGSGRVAKVSAPEFMQSHRGKALQDVVGPAFIPVSIWNEYLDDTPQAMAREGTVIAPSPIRTTHQLLDDLKKAAAKGGPERGWLADRIKKLKPKKDPDVRGHVELLEFEGDLLVPKSEGSIFLPNYLVTVAVGSNAPEVVRMRENPRPKRSHIVGYYMRHDLKSVYGQTPLMSGRPLQEVCSFALNDLMAAGRLSVLPPVTYDRNDPNYASGKGPEIFPGAMWGAERLDGVKAQIGLTNPEPLLQVYVGLNKKYEDVTGVNDPRRGAQVRSHTTTGAHELEAIRGVARTVDFALDLSHGPLTNILYAEYDIIKDVLKKPQPIPINASGMNGWVKLASADLADEVFFDVSGADGEAERQQKAMKFVAATQQAVQIAVAGAQLGKQVDLDFVAMIQDLYQEAGFNNAGKYVRVAEAAPGAAAGQPGVPGAGGPMSPNQVAQMAALVGGAA